MYSGEVPMPLVLIEILQISSRTRAVQCSQLTLHLDSASRPARAAAYLSWLNVLA